MKKQFPFFTHHTLAYLDNAATTQKPQMVIDRMTTWYTQECAPVYRSIYQLAEDATNAYEQVRSNVAEFIGAGHADEIVFTKGATESINCVASSWAKHQLQPGQTIVLTQGEHHANIVPWQMIARERKANILYIPLLPSGHLDLSTLNQLITSDTKIVSLALTSHVFGIRHDVAPIIVRAHAVGARVMLDMCQTVPHEQVNIQELQADFATFSGHKMGGPTGIGVLYAKREVHEQLQPYQVGGGMVQYVDNISATWQNMPHRLEAGTPPIAQVIGLGAAIDWYKKEINFSALKQHEHALCLRAHEALSRLPGITIISAPETSMVTFTVAGHHPHDVAAFLAAQGVCVRAGNLCAQPLFNLLALPSGAVRASFFVYTTKDDIARFIDALGQLVVK